MKNLFKTLFLIPLSLLALSCTDLDEEIKGDFTSDFDPANPGVGIRNNVNGSSPNDGLSAAFTRVLNGTANHGSYFSVSEISSDEAVITQKGGDWFDGGIWLQTHEHDFNPAQGGINGAWGDLYGGVTQCNIALADGGLDASGTAQIRMLRAYFYWKLMDMFGNIKLVTTPGTDVAQTDRAAAFDFIESELLAAIPDLTAGRADYGRASQGAAYALLSRLYLNAEVYTGTPMYQEAIDAADMVINSGNYSLSPSYADVFAPDNVDNIEHIFIAPFDESTGTGMNIAQMTLHYPSQLTFRLQQQPWNGYSTLEDFYNSYADGDDRKENNFIVGPQTDLDGNPILDLAFDKADPDGAPINYTPEINELFPNGSRQAGARLGKFSFKIGQGPEMDNDFPLLRYGEVLLNKAEAMCRMAGDWNAGTMLVNELRSRANATPFTTMTETDFLAERGRELFMESLRRTDLIRFDQWGSAWWEKDAHNDPNLDIMPIPIEQINASASETFPLSQNPGY
ncbi:RagB/SusD family nutrient uptake outer membrane protein [Fulvivirga lutimaris]|uniref:RagB/SusD family nutrient uptake outer membrane protein n=1 Tax=Fulvivirga lutimaris TaxID=1819566 RepID=UPI0012BCA259|nr:RagB/SusD family nutrient uptake outer membrane protein [Fulvivirga lutimaris]MTI39602.1 RagB/SusD family nutrient uptake outer membrane protein [Fulvivirga lutimaris]